MDTLYLKPATQSIEFLRTPNQFIPKVMTRKRLQHQNFKAILFLLVAKSMR